MNLLRITIGIRLEVGFDRATPKLRKITTMILKCLISVSYMGLWEENQLRAEQLQGELN